MPSRDARAAVGIAPQIPAWGNADYRDGRIGHSRPVRSATLPKSALSRRGPARAAVALAALVAALALAGPAAAAPSPYRHDLARASAHLRIAIEIRPGQLGEYLRSSEIVCELGEKAEERSDEERAQADWSTLAQLVRERDRREMRAIDGAFVRADENLQVLLRRYSRAWRGQATKVQELKLGVTRTREGIRLMRQAMDRIAMAFSEWERHDCIGAVNGIEAGIRRIPAGIEKVNLGMQRLWRLPGS
jgi:hypothetical protein